MAYVRVEQRNARLAAGVRLDTVQGKDGPIVKGTAVVISNVRKGSGEGREEEASEVPVLMKSTEAGYAALEAAIRARHPYDTPEIIAWPVTRGLPAYLAWVEAETGAG